MVGREIEKLLGRGRITRFLRLCWFNNVMYYSLWILPFYFVCFSLEKEKNSLAQEDREEMPLDKAVAYTNEKSGRDI